MAIQRINYGAAPDDGTGDPLRVAFKKSDDNFADLDDRKAEQQDVATALAGKVDKETGKGLSTNDYTTTEKNKLAGVEDNAQANPGPATDTSDGLMSAADKAKLDGVEEGATANQSDAYLLDRAHHTGGQDIATVIGLPAALPALIKVDPSLPCIIKTGATTLAIKAGTHVKIGNAYVSFPLQTAVSMPAVLIPGEDYAVFVHPDGTASAVADPYFDPAEAPVPGALKIGGFHYGLVASGTTVPGGSFATTGAGMIWTQADVDNIAGINAFSIWDLVYRPKCDPRGMTRSDAGFWFDIYFCGTEHITNGTSRYNTDVASGAVLPRKPLIFGGNGAAKYTTLTWYEATEIALSHGKRLMSYQEFAAAAYGVTENQSLGGAASTIPATLRHAGYTSKPGGEQMSGNHYTWGAAAHGAGGSAWASEAWRGQTYGPPYGALFGGSRVDAGYSGSRCSVWAYSAWFSDWSFGLRAACDHYQG